MSEYVTVVSVDLQPKMNVINGAHSEHEKKSSFVTVLSINNNQNTTTISTTENPTDGEIVTVYRLPGERLGFGLKFQGGTQQNEKVQRLFIQSCDVDSPASRARASWGPLGEGDEIVEIDGEPVTGMTRIECVKCLKDRNVAINLLVKKREKSLSGAVKSVEVKKRPLPPPPPMVPPRKIVKKPQPKVEIPVAAETYLNTLDDDIRNDESDETGSTISSQISVISNFSSESDLSMLSTNASTSDLTKILTKPFQLIEREFNVNSSSVIDNLLLFSDSEIIEIDGGEKEKIDAKTTGTYENVEVNGAADEPRQYENIDIKLPPIPRPRSISMSQDACEIDAKTPTKTIESWLNDASTINGNLSSDKTVPNDDHEQNYEPIKFECFVAGDDEDDEKLGPPEMLCNNISEAYFNFSWCGNSANLPTIGEAEEEFSSIDGTGLVKVVKGPIFIVNTVPDSESETDGKCGSANQVHMEINNNNSLYLLKHEDKSDKNDKGMQCENKISQIVTAVGEVREKIIENSREVVIKEIKMEQNEQKSVAKTLKADSDESSQLSNDVLKSFNEIVTQKSENQTLEISPNESEENIINNKELITSDSERLGENLAVNLKVMSEEVQINDFISNIEANRVTQSIESKDDMTSLPTTPSAQHQFASNTQMEQKQLLTDRNSSESSRLPPDGREFPIKRLMNGFGEKQKTNSESTTTVDLIKSPAKATAIVAPLVPRKTHHFDEITNFVDSKPPFKSATLGRQRPLNWRNKDEKSEKSVKDKIAMFSNSTTDISHMLPKTKSTTATSASHRMSAKSTENIFSSSTKSTENIFNSSDFGSGKSKVNTSIKKKAMSVENLDETDYRSEIINYTPVSKPPSLHSTSTRPLTLNIGKAASVEDLLEPCESPRLPSRPPPTTAPVLSRRISFSGYTNTQIEENRKNSISNLLESRKKSMSKLRGLVIPEKVPEGDQKVLGLPVIRSKECELINGNVLTKTPVKAPLITRTISERKFEFEVKAAPRRAISVQETVKSPPVKPPRTSLIPSSSFKSVATDESDTESCLSSRGSRVSTPPVSPVAKKPLARTFSSETNTSISSNSTLTSGSGSQASCSSNASTPETRKIVENSRKSILASSKSRSGRECLEKSWRDEDSTDGGIDNDERRRVPKAKARSSIVNYKVVGPGDNIVDKVINVATYVEVVSSDSDDKPEVIEAIPCSPAENSLPAKKEAPQLNIMSDMAKWVRCEATKTETEAKEPKRVTPKFLEPPKKLSLSEIRKNFENKAAPAVPSPPVPKTPKEKPTSNHNRFSSWDSVASSSSGVSSELLGTGTGTNNSESLQTLQSDFGSFSSFGSSHSLITPQDLQLIIDEADPPLETPEAFVVVLARESPESSIGITLAGGSDYEAKEITIHRILVNSPADKDGRLKRGDRLLSINGLSMRGLTHRESLSVLKSPRADVVMVVTRSKSVLKTNSLKKTKLGSMGSLSSLTEKNDSIESDGISVNKKMQASKSLEMDLDNISNEANDIDVIGIVKDGAGLGFSIDGGYDSPMGNKPLVIKKIFMGGAAERTSNLKVGDEILEINGNSIEKQTRIDVWNMIKKLPQGDAVQLTIKRK